MSNLKELKEKREQLRQSLRELDNQIRQEESKNIVFVSSETSNLVGKYFKQYGESENDFVIFSKIKKQEINKKNMICICGDSISGNGTKGCVNLVEEGFYFGIRDGLNYREFLSENSLTEIGEEEYNKGVEQIITPHLVLDHKKSGFVGKVYKRIGQRKICGHYYTYFFIVRKQRYKGDKIKLAGTYIEIEPTVRRVVISKDSTTFQRTRRKSNEEVWKQLGWIELGSEDFIKEIQLSIWHRDIASILNLI